MFPSLDLPLYVRAAHSHKPKYGTRYGTCRKSPEGLTRARRRGAVQDQSIDHPRRLADRRLNWPNLCGMDPPGSRPDRASRLQLARSWSADTVIYFNLGKIYWLSDLKFAFRLLF